MPSVTTQPKESEVPDTKSSPRGYSAVSPSEDKDDWRRPGERNDVELSVIGDFSTYKSIDADILLENIKVHPYRILYLSCWKLFMNRSNVLQILLSLLFGFTAFFTELELNDVLSRCIRFPRLCQTTL